MSYSAASVMDLSAALLNNVSKSVFSYTVLLPYLKLAHDDLESKLIDNGVTTNNVVDKTITHIAQIIPSPEPRIVALPANFFLPIRLEERLLTSTNDDDYTDMTEVDRIDPLGTASVRPELNIWTFAEGNIKVPPCNTNRNIRLTYKKKFAPITSDGSNEEVDKSRNFIAFRTAAIAAEFKGRNKVLADSLNLQAADSLDTLISIYTKANQANRVRRKRFSMFNNPWLRRRIP